jgi:hypothetical protein
MLMLYNQADQACIRASHLFHVSLEDFDDVPDAVCFGEPARLLGHASGLHSVDHTRAGHSGPDRQHT